MTLVFRNQLSQTATQIRTLLATPPEEWHAEAETRATLALLDLEDQIAVNAEYSESLLNEAAKFEDGQRLFLSAFGKLPAASKDAEEKAYDDLLNDIRIDDLHAASRQMVGTISRRIRAYKRQAAELRAQIAQEQTRATIDFTLEEHANREGSVLRDILQNMQSQQMLQTQQMVQTMQDMLQTLTLPQQTAATTPVSPVVTSAPTVSAVFHAPAGLQHTAATVGTLQANANHLFPSTPVSVSSAPGGPFPVSTAPVSMPIYTTGNMGAHSTFTPHSSHLTTPTGAGFGGQRQAPQYFSSPFVTQMQTSAVPHAFATPSRFHLPLPTLAIPHFSGERSKWRPFWHMFELMTQNHPELSDLEKHTLLLTYLKGDAMKLIDGIPLSHGNFHIVIDILKKRYDNRPQLITDLYSQLQKLEQASSLAKLKDLYFGFVRICRQLEVEGESPNHSPILWKMVYDKLSTQYLNKLLAREPPGANWTTLSIQGALWEVIEREEKLAEHRAEHGTDRPTKDRSDETYKHHVLNGIEKQRSWKELKCFFCQESHWSVQCNKYPDHDSRRERCKQIGLCTKCLRKGHRSKDCDKDYTCQICEKNHLNAICPKYGDKPNRNVNLVAKSDETEYSSNEESSDEETTEPANQINTLIAAQSNSDAEKTVSQTRTTCKTTQYLTTMFMAAEAKVFNPQKPSRSATALIILDSASHLTFISDKLARDMALPIDRKLKLRLSPFSDDTNRVVKLETTSVKFGLQFSNGHRISIQGYTKKRVAGPSPLAVLKKDDIRRLWNKRAIPAQHKVPDILIGMDYFHRFQVEKGKKLPNGFYLSSTAMGPVLSGRGKLTADQFVPQSNSIQVIGNISGPDSAVLSEKPEHVITNEDSNTLRLNEVNRLPKRSHQSQENSRQSKRTPPLFAAVRETCQERNRTPQRSEKYHRDHSKAERSGSQSGAVRDCSSLKSQPQTQHKSEEDSHSLGLQMAVREGIRSVATEPPVPACGRILIDDSTKEHPYSIMLDEGLGNRTLNSFQKKMTIPSHPMPKMESHCVTHVPTPLRPSVQRRRQVKPEAEVQPQSMPEYCHSKRTPGKNQPNVVLQLKKHHTRGQNSHKEWAVEVFHTKKHNLRHHANLDQSKVEGRIADHRSRRLNVSLDHTDNPIKGPLDRRIQNQAPIIDTPCFHTGKSHHEFKNSVQMNGHPQLTRNSKRPTRNRSALCQTEFEPSEIVVPDSTNAEIKPLRRRRWNILAPGVSRAESRKELPKINH